MQEASVQNFTWEGVNDKTWLPSAHAQLSSPLAQLLPMATGKEGNDRRTFLKNIFWGVLNTAVPTPAVQTFLRLVTQSILGKTA